MAGAGIEGDAVNAGAVQQEAYVTSMCTVRAGLAVSLVVTI